MHYRTQRKMQKRLSSW